MSTISSLVFVSQRIDGNNSVAIRTVVPCSQDDYGRYSAVAPHEIVAASRNRALQLAQHPDVIVTLEPNGRTLLTAEKLEDLMSYLTYLFDMIYPALQTQNPTPELKAA